MKKRGKGIACVVYGIGNTGAANPAAAFVEVLPDGSVQVLVGAADIGQGSDTALGQIAAEVLGVTFDCVRVTSADTAVTPEGGASSASRQTYVSGNAVRLAADQAKRILKDVAARLLAVAPESLRFGRGDIYSSDAPGKRVSVALVARQSRAEGRLPVGSGWFNPSFTALDAETGWGSPYATYGFGAQVAEVEVDTETGEVQVLNVWAAHDVGKAVNPTSVEGQIEGGVVMGLGQALLEEVVLTGGATLTDSCTTYLLPTIADVPDIATTIVEAPEPSGPFGAKGIGEPALIPTAAAIANAVADAIGVQITDLPITPEKVLKALSRRGWR